MSACAGLSRVPSTAPTSPRVASFSHVRNGQQKAAGRMSPRRVLLPGGKAVTMAAGHTPDEQSITELLPLVRRVVAAKVRDPQLVDDLVQETLLRVMAARSRVEADTLAPYATVTARNLIASLARSDDRARRK